MPSKDQISKGQHLIAKLHINILSSFVTPSNMSTNDTQTGLYQLNWSTSDNTRMTQTLTYPSPGCCLPSKTNNNIRRWCIISYSQCVSHTSQHPNYPSYTRHCHTATYSEVLNLVLSVNRITSYRKLFNTR